MSDPVAESLLEYRKLFPALEECVHFISHSLGCVPAQAKEDLGEFFELWRTKSITAWGDWLPEVEWRAGGNAAELSPEVESGPTQVRAPLADVDDPHPRHIPVGVDRHLEDGARVFRRVVGAGCIFRRCDERPARVEAEFVIAGGKGVVQGLLDAGSHVRLRRRGSR